MAKCVCCEGSGILDCSICYGKCIETGMNNCFYCNWDGPKECPVCDGTGEVQFQHCNDEYFYIDPYYQMNNGILVIPSYQPLGIGGRNLVSGNFLKFHFAYFTNKFD